jgi:hypothetical protein
VNQHTKGITIPYIMPGLDNKERKNDTLHLKMSMRTLLGTEPSDGSDIPSGYFPVTAEEKAISRALNRKLDIFLLPFLSLLYLFNGLDRGNVGNAQTQGSSTQFTFESERHIHATQALLQTSAQHRTT